MARLAILEHPDPRLRQASQRVDDFGSDTRQLVDDLLETLYATSGVGLSAPQVGVLRQVIVMDHSEARDRPEVIINPELVARTAYGFVQERCLSVPGVAATIVRATEIRVRYQDTDGELLERDVSGMPAVCLLHEMDHLEGRLFIDRLSALRRLGLRLSGKLKRAS